MAKVRLCTEVEVPIEAKAAMQVCVEAAAEERTDLEAAIKAGVDASAEVGTAAGPPTAVSEFDAQLI